MIEEATLNEVDDQHERGAVLLWVAGSLVALLAFAALAVDLGWYYVQDSRLQRAADAAALAGVIHVPGYLSNAENDARDASDLNGFPTTGLAATTTFSGNLVDDDKYTVELASDVDLFFAPVIGWHTLPISAKSTAQYVKPVPLGSPDNCFGEMSPGNQGLCSSGDPNFWAAVNGPYTAKEQGDPYATRCEINPWPEDSPATAGSCEEYGEIPTSTPQPDYRGTYYFGVEVPAGATNLRVQLLNPHFYSRGSTSSGTGDTSAEISYSSNPGFDTVFTLHTPDTTPTDPTDNAAIGSCTRSYPTRTSSTGNYSDYWSYFDLCSSVIAAPTAGIYVLKVETTGTGIGSNSFSLLANASGGSPRVYGINDMSIFTNQDSTTATLNLAEVDPIHAGKTLVLSLYDAGEDDGTATMTVKRPDGSTAICSWFAEDDETRTVFASSPSGNCSIVTSSSSQRRRFNGDWLTINVEIPDAYTCTTNCWWTMEIVNNLPHDRTTWSAKIVGNPVRLIPNP